MCKLITITFKRKFVVFKLTEIRKYKKNCVGVAFLCILVVGLTVRFIVIKLLIIFLLQSMKAFSKYNINLVVFVLGFECKLLSAIIQFKSLLKLQL